MATSRTIRRAIIALSGLCTVLLVSLVVAALSKAGFSIPGLSPLEQNAVWQYWRENLGEPDTVEVIDWQGVYPMETLQVGRLESAGAFYFWQAATEQGTLVRVKFRAKFPLIGYDVRNGKYLIRDGRVVNDYSSRGIRVAGPDLPPLTWDQEGMKSVN